MSTTTKIAPVVVAGIGGILIGYLIAPDVDAVRDDFAARFNEQTPLIQQLQASVANIEARMEAMPDAESLNTSIQEQLTAAEGRLATQTEAITAQLSEQGGEDQTASGLEEVRGGLDTLTQEVAALRDELAASVEAQQSAAATQAQPAEDEAGRLAEEIGASGAVLLPGQGAIFGGSRIDLSELDVEGGTATMTPEGGEAANVSEGETVQLSETCSIRLAGIASGAAYLGTEECAEPAAAEGAAAEGAPGGEPAAESPPDEAAAEPEPMPDSMEGAAAQPAEGQQPPTEAGQLNGELSDGQPPAQEGQQPGSDVPAQGSQAVPDQQPGQAEQNAPGAQQQQQPPAQ